MVVLWIQFLSCTARLWRNKKDCWKKKKKHFHACTRYIHENGNLDSFSWQNSFDTFRFASSKFRFSTSYDLKTTKLSPLHCPIVASFRLFEPIMFSCILKKRMQNKQTNWDRCPCWYNDTNKQKYQWMTISISVDVWGGRSTGKPIIAIWIEGEFSQPRMRR